MKLNKKIKRFIAYIFIPLFFMVIGYSLTTIVFFPHFQTIYAAGSLLMMAEDLPVSIPMIGGPVELSSVFDESAADVTLANADVTIIDDDIVELHISDIELPVLGQHYAEIRSEQLGLLAPIFYGGDDEILRSGVAHHPGSFFLGFGGTVVLTGHNTTHFLPLQNIELDDIVELQTNYGHFEYRVVEIAALSEADAAYRLRGEFLLQTEEEILVLQTDYPFVETIGVADQRLLIFAEKVSGPTVDFMARY